MLFGYVNLYEEMLWLSTPPWTASSPAAGRGPGCPAGSIPAAPCAAGPVPGDRDRILRLFDGTDPSRHVADEIPGPEVQGSRVLDEGGHFPTRLLHIKGIDGLAKGRSKRIGRKVSLSLPVAALPHTALEMGPGQIRVICGIP